MGEDPEPADKGKDGEYKVKEDQYLNAASLWEGDKVQLDDMSGCTGTVLWDEENMPSA